MKKLKCGSALALTVLLCGTALVMPEVALAQPEAADPLTDTIIVTGQRTAVALEQQADPVAGHATAADAAALVAQLPGAALVNNGALSGQVQYRGLFSERLSVHVGGQDFQSGGPNAMDPPLHYVPVILLDRITVSRGAAPVSDGPGLGAAVNARLKQVGYSDSASMTPALDLAASYRSADDGLAAGGVVGLASDTYRVNAIASWEEGDDYRFPGGKAGDTAYSRLVYGLSAGMRHAGNELSLDLRRQETGKSGNPPFPMDIDFFDTNFARLGFDGSIARHAVKLQLAYTGVRHAMDNYTSRPAPAMPAMFRRTDASADTMNGSASIVFGALQIGADASWVDHDVTIRNPNNAAFEIGAFERVRQSRFGGFAQLSGETGGWQGDLGVRLDRQRASMADPQVGSGVPAMVQALATATAAGNRPRTDTTWDLVARIWKQEGTVRPRLVLSRKTRVPNAIERFGWLPVEASGGLADRNIYIGDQNLKPEVAWAAEAGVDLGEGAVTFRPSVFYRRIDDYIQGTPVPMSMMPQIMIATMNGDSTPLIFSNIDAELYGFDGDLAWQIVPALRFDATVSYVRGKRRDAPDNLYRIAPLNGRASLTYGGEDWSVKAEAVGAARQRKVSSFNEEPTSPGWVIANLWADWRISPSLQISGGVENVFDRRYADHLAGINRVANSDVAVGERMPGVGRSGFIRIGVTY